MKKLLLTVCIAIIFCFAVGSGVTTAADDNGSVFDPEILLERGGDRGSSLAGVDAEIFSGKADRTDKLIRRYEQEKIDGVISSLFTDEEAYAADTSQYDAALASLFNEPMKFYSRSGENTAGAALSTIVIVVGAVFVAAVSYMATIAFRNRKKR